MLDEHANAMTNTLFASEQIKSISSIPEIDLGTSQILSSTCRSGAGGEEATDHGEGARQPLRVPPETPSASYSAGSQLGAGSAKLEVLVQEYFREEYQQKTSSRPPILS